MFEKQPASTIKIETYNCPNENSMDKLSSRLALSWRAISLKHYS